MKTTSLKLGDVITTAGTQIRTRLDDDAIQQYAEAMESKAEFPPIVVFHDGKNYILADGFHRCAASARIGNKTITAEVRKGCKSDALKYALSANAAHGLRRTNADKRRSVELALAEWPEISNEHIAEICAIGAPLVGRVRQELEANSNIVRVETRIGRDGKRRKVKRAAKAKPQPEPQEAEDKPHVVAHTEAVAQPVDNPKTETSPKQEAKPEQPTPPEVKEGLLRVQMEASFLRWMDQWAVCDKQKAREVVQSILNKSK